MIALHVAHRQGSKAINPPKVVQQFTRQFLHRAKEIIVKRPRVSAAVTAFCLSGTGDVIAQRAERTRDGHASQPYDAKRTLAQACFSATYASQIYVPWIRFLESSFGPARTLRTAVLKAACDNMVLCPLVGLPTYYSWSSVAAGHSLQEASERFRTGYWSSLCGSWLIWGPVQLANFSLVAAPFRVTFMYGAEIAWGCMASFTSRAAKADSRDPAPD